MGKLGFEIDMGGAQNLAIAVVDRAVKDIKSKLTKTQDRNNAIRFFQNTRTSSIDLWLHATGSNIEPETIRQELGIPKIDEKKK